MSDLFCILVNKKHTMKQYKDTNLKVSKDGRVFGPRGERKHQIDSGYHRVAYDKPNKLGREVYSIHRMVAELYIPNPDDKPCVNHINGDKSDNSVENLEWVTYSENMKHAYNKGLWKSPMAIEWSKKDLDTIWYLHRLGWSQYKIADEMGVSQPTIGRILNRGNKKIRI